MRRAAAYQAFYEHMPVRPILSHPDGPVMRVYDRFTFGDLIEISMIDGRQYRSRAACYAPPNKGGGHLESDASCPERRDAGRTMMGFAQEAWLDSALARSKAQWNVIAQDVLMAQLRQKSLTASRVLDRRLGRLSGQARRGCSRASRQQASNPVVIGGDIHAFFANDLHLDFDDPNSPVVATEFVGTSIASYGPPYELINAGAAGQPARPFLRKPQARLCQRRSRAQGDATRMRVVSDAHDPQATYRR